MVAKTVVNLILNIYNCAYIALLLLLVEIPCNLNTFV